MASIDRRCVRVDRGGVLGATVHPYYNYFAAFVAANLIQSSFTGWCPMMALCGGLVFTSNEKRFSLGPCDRAVVWRQVAGPLRNPEGRGTFPRHRGTGADSGAADRGHSQPGPISVEVTGQVTAVYQATLASRIRA